MAQSEMRLHLVVILSDGRQMLATCAASTTVRQLTEQLEDELAQTFRAALQLRYLGKVVTAPQGGSAGSGDLPPHLALSAAARAGDLLKDGDTVLAVAAEPPPERPRDSGDSPEPELDSVSACAARWEEVERRAQRGRRHIASSLATLGPQEPRAVVSEEGRRLLGGLVQAGSSTAGCEPALAQAAVAALASATAIPQLAGLQATTVLRSADDISRGKELDAEGSDKSVAPTVASLLLSLCRSPSTDVRRSAEGVLRHLQAEARAEQARADPSYSKQQHRIGNQAATGSSRSDSSGRAQERAGDDISAAADGSVVAGDSNSLGITHAVEAAPPATLLKRIATSAAGPAGAASVAAALRAMSLQALRETSRWELLRTPGLVATLIAIAGGDDDAQVPDLDQSEDFAAENSAGTLQRHERRRGQAAEADDDRRRLAAKTLAHMGTTEEIREKLLQHRGLRDLVVGLGDGAAKRTSGERRGIVDEGVAVYLQMLKPRAKSPPRFPD